MRKVVTLEVTLRAQSALDSSPIYALRDLRVEQDEFDEEMLCISGRVDSFYHKQLAQEVVRSVADGFRVVNSIRVR